MKITDGNHLALCRAAAATWPRTDWPHWHRYQTGDADKFATKDAARLTPPCRQLIAHLSGLPAPAGTFPDLELHGAGMHWLREGGFLGLHRDGQRHPLSGWYRRWNAVLFLSDCSGGELIIDGQPPIRAQLGRLVTFESQIPHAVARVTAGDRKSLSLFWWSLDGSGETTSAQFA